MTMLHHEHFQLALLMREYLQIIKTTKQIMRNVCMYI